MTAPTEGVGRPTTAGEDAVSGFLSLLELDRVGEGEFAGDNPDSWPGAAVFGGLVAAQALRAAMETVDVDRRVHSLHAYFLRPGQPGVPIRYSVDRTRDGRSFTTRSVSGRQGGETIFTMSTSFHRAGEEGIDYQLAAPADAPDPDDIVDRTGGFPVPSTFFAPFDIRSVGATPPAADGTYRSTRRVWVRTTAALPDDHRVHAVVLTFMSDMAVVLAARPPGDPSRPPWEGFMGASLDHAVWFHRPVRADAWLYYDLHALSTFSARGLARGVFYDRDGSLVASVTQEALIRQLP